MAGSESVDVTRPGGRPPLPATVPVAPPVPLAWVLEQHADDASFLWLLRDMAVHDPVASLDRLVDLEERLDAHLEGLLIGGDAGIAECVRLLETGEAGEVFVAASVGLHTANGKLLSLAATAGAANQANLRALLSAAGWLARENAGAIGASLMDSASPVYHMLGLAACTLHRVDPGVRLARLLASDQPVVRARAARAAGELARRDLLPQLHALGDADPAVAFWAAWSRLLLGDVSATAPLREVALRANPWQRRALDVLLRILPVADAHEVLRGLSQQPGMERLLMLATAMVGDPHYLGWLVNQMQQPEYARLAGVAFAMITGLDLAADGFDQPAPDDEDDDEDGEDDEAAAAEGGGGAADAAPEGAAATAGTEDHGLPFEAGLPFPDAELIYKWYQASRHRFTPGQRHLGGEVITPKGCLRLLREGSQGVRAAAALELALRQPEAPLFEVRAPGRRQLALLKAPGE